MGEGEEIRRQDLAPPAPACNIPVVRKKVEWQSFLQPRSKVTPGADIVGSLWGRCRTLGV